MQDPGAKIDAVGHLLDEDVGDGVDGVAELASGEGVY